MLDPNFDPYKELQEAKSVINTLVWAHNQHDEMMLDPIPFELESLEQAKDYLKRYGSRHVAAWLTKTTGRYISHAGLLKRVKDEQRYTSKVATLRKWAARYRKAVEEAERYENRRGTKVAKQARDILDAVDARHAKPE